MIEWTNPLTRWSAKREAAERLNNDPALRALCERCEALDPRAMLNRCIRETRFVVLDTETTGLRAYAGDEIVSIAMLELSGLQRTGRDYQTLVNPGRPIPEVSTEIHGIADHDVEDAPEIYALLPKVCDFLHDAVVVGHHIAFDLRFLNKSLHRFVGCRLRNPALDTMSLYLGHSGRLGHYTLEEVAEHCHINITGRHTALGDALATADVFAHLAVQLTAPDQPVAKLAREQVARHGAGL